MRLHINAFKQGISRIFTLPRLSLPLISTLGLTLAAVLTVIAVANTLLFQPLPDVDEKNLYQVEVQLDLNEGLRAPFFSDPRRIASIKKLYGDSLSWGHIEPGQSAIEVGTNEIQVSRFNAVTGSPEVLGLSLLNGQGSDIDNAEEGVWISKTLWQSAFGGLDNLAQQTLRLDGNDYPIFGVFDDLTSLNAIDLGGPQQNEQVWRFQNLEETLESPDNIVLNLGPVTFLRGPQSAIPSPADLEAWFVDYVNSDITIDRAREFSLV